MYVQQDETGGLTERVGDVKSVGIVVAEHFLEAFGVLFHHVRLEIRDFFGAFGAGEIEEERTLHDRHFQREQFLIRDEQPRDTVSRDDANSFGGQNPINFPFAIEAVRPVEEFDRCEGV